MPGLLTVLLCVTRSVASEQTVALSALHSTINAHRYHAIGGYEPSGAELTFSGPFC